jgi:hypothetical protein
MSLRSWQALEQGETAAGEHSFLQRVSGNGVYTLQTLIRTRVGMRERGHRIKRVQAFMHKPDIAGAYVLLRARLSAWWVIISYVD